MDVAWWALIVSGLSLTLSGWTVWRTRWAKPVMLMSWDFGDPANDVATDSLRCIVRNRGRGEALDVRLEAMRSDGTAWPYAVGGAAVVGFGEHVELWFTFDQRAPQGHDEVVILNQFGGSRSIRGVPQEGRSRTVTARLTWHYAPRTTNPHVLTQTHTDPAPSTA